MSIQTISIESLETVTGGQLALKHRAQAAYEASLGFPTGVAAAASSSVGLAIGPHEIGIGTAAAAGWGINVYAK